MNNFSFHKKITYAAAFIISCCFVSACENDQKKIDDITKTVIMKEEAINVESYLSQNGKMKAKLKAPLMYRVSADTLYVEFPNKLHVDFYNDSTKIETYLDSKYGKYFEGLGKVYLRDSVVVITMKGDTLRSPDLWWDQNTKLFYTDKHVIYRSSRGNIVGSKGLVATQDLRDITFKQTTGTVPVAEGGIPK